MCDAQVYQDENKNKQNNPVNFAAWYAWEISPDAGIDEGAAIRNHEKEEHFFYR